MSDLINRLRDTAATREKAYADDSTPEKRQSNQALIVVARLSREDAALMREAVEALERAKKRLQEIADGIAFQPRVHAASALKDLS